MLSTTLLIPFLLPAAYAQLNTLAVAAGLKYFGTAADNGELTDTAYAALLSNTSDFSQITPGNGQKWAYTERTQGVFTYTSGDVVPAFAAKNAQLLRCHTLVWHSQLPDWVTSGTWNNETMTAVMKLHITSLMTHYKGQCYAWDVVNEAITDSAGAMRTSVFYNAMGEDYIRIAFETAALADPDAKLYYNDYNIGYSGAKATTALRLVTDLVNAGVKIDGVGEQGHYIVGAMPSKADQIATLQKYTALGLEVAFTELDIRMTLPSTDAKLAQQSADYENAVGACLELTGCIGITIWGASDKISWIPSTFPGQGAALLFDESYNKKPAYFAVASVLAAAGTGSAGTGSAGPAVSSVAALVPSSTAAPSGMTTSYIRTSSAVASATAASSPISASVETAPSSAPVVAPSSAIIATSTSASQAAPSAEPSPEDEYDC